MSSRDEQIDAALTAASVAITAVHRLIESIQAMRRDDAAAADGAWPPVAEVPVGPVTVGMLVTGRIVAGHPDGPGVEMSSAGAAYIDADGVRHKPDCACRHGQPCDCDTRAISDDVAAKMAADIRDLAAATATPTWVVEGGIVDSELRPDAAETWPPVTRAEAVALADAYDAAMIAPPAIEGAMPPGHCVNHRERTDHCRHCIAAGQAQDLWVVERDTKAARARQEVADEVAAQKAAEASDDVHLPPGRTAFRVAKATLDARTAAKKPEGPAGPPLANADQLTAIATALGKQGLTDRGKRLELLGEVVGRPLSTMRELTRAEAGYVLSRLHAPPMPTEPPGDGERSSDGPLDTSAEQVEDPEGEKDRAMEAAEAAAAREAGSHEADPSVVPDDDGTEPEPEGDEAAEDEFRRDLDGWRDYGDGVPIQTPLAMTGGTDDPPF